MRALFFRTPAIAVPALVALCEVAEVVGVVCQPDRPAGRGLRLAPPPIKEQATARGLPVVQPAKIRTADFAAWIREQRADVAVVMAYGRILPPAVLAAPRRGCLNLHASLLPRYRGAAPINWAIVRGETETGISLMQMDEGCDTGPVYCRRAAAILPDETAGELSERLAALAASVVREDLPRAVAGELGSEPQVEAAATLAPLLSKADGAVDFTRSARAVHDHCRGMTPWPGAHTTLGAKHFKLLATRLGAETGSAGPPGTVLGVDQAGAEIACGEGTIVLGHGQLEGRRPLAAHALATGRSLGVGMCLGS